MPKFWGIISVVFIAFSAELQCKAYCSFDSDIKQIYQDILNLDLDKANAKVIEKGPNNLNQAYLLLENYIDFYQLFIHEQEADFKKLAGNKNKRLTRIKVSGLVEPWSNFLRAEILLQWALIYLKREDYFLALQDISQATTLLNEAIVKFPEFSYSYKSMGILHALLSSIPEGWSWATKLMGLGGNLAEGKKELLQFICFAELKDDMFLMESYVAMSFIKTYLDNSPKEAYQYFSDKIWKTDPNPLLAFVHSKLAMRAGYNEATLNSILSLPQADRNKLPVLHFILGLAKLQKLSPDADVYFLQFLKQTKSELYVKEAFQKLSWHAIIFNNIDMYHHWIQKGLHQGKLRSDEDRQAQLYFSVHKTPQPILLKARLLCDGGYAKEGLQLLKGLMPSMIIDPEYQLEACYRMGRLYQLLEQEKDAIYYFDLAIRMDPNERSFMSTQAILQKAILAEKQRNSKLAKEYFQRVLKRNPEQYQRSLHQKAQAGLSRIK